MIHNFSSFLFVQVSTSNMMDNFLKLLRDLSVDDSDQGRNSSSQPQSGSRVPRGTTEQDPSLWDMLKNLADDETNNTAVARVGANNVNDSGYTSHESSSSSSSNSSRRSSESEVAVSGPNVGVEPRRPQPPATPAVSPGWGGLLALAGVAVGVAAGAYAISKTMSSNNAHQLLTTSFECARAVKKIKE